jgi:hypothetical protein
MDWQAIGTVADVAAAFGVIITLIYLAIQIREQTKESRLSATRELARDWTDGLRFIAGNDANFDIYQRATVDYASLSVGDRIRAYMMFSSQLRVLEIQHLHVSQGKFESTMVASMEYRIKQLADMPGVRYWWANNKDQYNAEFIKYIEHVSPLASE